MSGLNNNIKCDIDVDLNPLSYKQLKNFFHVTPSLTDVTNSQEVELNINLNFH